MTKYRVMIQVGDGVSYNASDKPDQVFDTPIEAAHLLFIYLQHGHSVFPVEGRPNYQYDHKTNRYKVTYAQTSFPVATSEMWDKLNSLMSVSEGSSLNVSIIKKTVYHPWIEAVNV